MKPGREAAAAFEASQRAPGSHEGFLRAILRSFTLTGETQAQAVDSRRELPVQTFECGHVPAGCRDDRIRWLTAGIHGESPLQSLDHRLCALPEYLEGGSASRVYTGAGFLNNAAMVLTARSASARSGTVVSSPKP